MAARLTHKLLSHTIGSCLLQILVISGMIFLIQNPGIILLSIGNSVFFTEKLDFFKTGNVN